MTNFLDFCISRTLYIRGIILLVLFCLLPFLGSDCDNGIIGSGTSGSILGTWRLTGVTGYLQDVCPGEVVTYDSNGTATLQCPNSNPITRLYTVSNNILTYTETAVQYDITTLSSTTLVLKGRNIGRNLSYTKIPADMLANPGPNEVNAGKNSSEN